jgi:hypothetical protein
MFTLFDLFLLISIIFMAGLFNFMIFYVFLGNSGIVYPGLSPFALACALNAPEIVSLLQGFSDPQSDMSRR